MGNYSPKNGVFPKMPEYKAKVGRSRAYSGFSIYMEHKEMRQRARWLRMARVGGYNRPSYFKCLCGKRVSAGDLRLQFPRDMSRNERTWKWSAKGERPVPRCMKCAVRYYYWLPCVDEYIRKVQAYREYERMQGSYRAKLGPLPMPSMEELGY